MYFVRLRSLRGIGMLLTMAISLSACGGSHGTLPPAASSSSGGGTPVGSAAATFTFTFPKNTSSTKRSPKYLSSATASVTVQVTDVKNHGSSADIYANVPASLKAVQFQNFTNTTGNPNTPGQCGTDPLNSGNVKCTAVFQFPIGDATITVTSWSANAGTGSTLSQQVVTEWVQQGVNNTFAVSLDANAATMTVSGTAPCTAGGSIGASYGSVGTGPATFTVTYTDPATKMIVGPGLPKLNVSATGVTGGSLNIAVNQATQTFTVTPSAVTATGTINVSATPGSAGDGLSFNQTKSFTFSTGNAPPGSFLAVVEQTTATSGQVSLFTVGLGGNTANSDTFTAYSPATLAVTNSINENKPDVDGPQAATFDKNGDLLIANGGSTVGGDYGDLACVPAGAIATGANLATTTSTNVDGAQGIAYDSRDGSVALENNPGGAQYNMVEFLLASNYIAAPPSRDIANPAPTHGDNGVVNLPSLPAGTYATAITTGTAQPPHGTGSSKVAIMSPAGVETDITDPTIDDPTGLAWDAQNGQLVIANGSSWTTSLDFYSVSPITKVKTISNGFQYYAVAASPDGHIAVAQTGLSPDFQVQVFDNTAARNPVGGPIPFNGTSTQNGNYIFDTGNTSTGPNGNNIDAITWLSNTKLLIALRTVASGKQGLYIFDITNLSAQTAFGYDDTPPYGAFAPFPTETGFQLTSLTPFGVAYKP